MQKHLLACLVLGCLLVMSADAQQPPPAVQPNPQAPTIAAPFPMGMQRGTALDLTLTGANLADPVQVLTSFPGKVSFPGEGVKDAGKLAVRLEAPKDAPLGWHTIRVATRRGVSNFRLFCIDDLPQVLEKDNNHKLADAQSIPISCVVCGRVDAEQTDYFKVSLPAGQRLSFEVLGRRLGSGLDPQLSLLDAKTGRQLAFSDDSPGQGKDPRLTYVFKEAGEYAIELRDVRYQGGADWYYRLRIGDFPSATTPVPLAAKRGSTVKVQFAGPSVDGVPPLTVTVPKEAEVEVVWLTPKRPSGEPGWPVALMATDLDEGLEAEPNDEPVKANRVNVPGAVSGRLQRKGDLDHLVFAAKKDQRYLIEAQTQEFHSPTSVYLVLKDAKGAQVAASNPANDPARIDFTASADGDLTLAVEHLHYWGGPEESYRITLLTPEPGFTLSAAIDRVDVPQGGQGLIPVQVTRRDYNGPIELQVTGPAGITGAAVIPEGKTSALLSMMAASNTEVGAHGLSLAGKASSHNPPISERAEVRAVVSRELGNLPFPPRHLHRALAVAITEPPPYTLEAKLASPEVLRGRSAPVIISVRKAAGFDEEITLTSVVPPIAQGQQPPFPPVTAKIPKGQTEVKVELKPPANAPLGSTPFAFTGRSKYQNRDIAVVTPAADLAIVPPFELRVDAGDGVINPDGKLKLKVKALRKGGYKGPITLEVRNLPANVSAGKATLAENQDQVEIDLSAAGNATLGAKKDVNLLGTATAAGNQQNPSANFTIEVVKK